MFERRKLRKEREDRINELQRAVDAIQLEELRKAKNREERRDALELVNAMTREDQNEIQALSQEELLADAAKVDIEIPDKFWWTNPGYYKAILQPDGEAWIRREIKKKRREEIDYWAKLVVPVISLIISIMALVSSRHH